MEDYLYYIILLVVSIISIVGVRSLGKKLRTNRNRVKMPPSPTALPLIGHLYLLRPLVHQSLQRLSNKFGGIIRLKLGADTFIVISDANVANEIFRTHDLIFSYRPEIDNQQSNIYNGFSFFAAPYGPYWRFMKKLCMTELLSSRRLDKFSGLRKEEISQFLSNLLKSSKDIKPVHMGIELTKLTNNIICRMAMSVKRCGEEEEAEKWRKLVEEILSEGVKTILGNLMGPLTRFDLLGFGKRTSERILKYDRLMRNVVEEHKLRSELVEDSDLLDVLLAISKDEESEVKLSEKQIKAFFLDLLMAGTETSARAVEWVIAELTNHPSILEKVKEEIDKKVGTNRLIEASDVHNLPYLQATVMETMRLYPLGPLIPRLCNEDCQVAGYFVAKNTRVLVNTYAIMRDPNFWENPDEFIPERFLAKDEHGDWILMKIKDLSSHFVPFGGGRRACPGLSFAMSTVPMVIGSLIQCFNWKVDASIMVDGRIDMSQRLGVSLTMAHPFLLHPFSPKLFI